MPTVQRRQEPPASAGQTTCRTCRCRANESGCCSHPAILRKRAPDGVLPSPGDERHIGRPIAASLPLLGKAGVPRARLGPSSRNSRSPTVGRGTACGLRCACCRVPPLCPRTWLDRPSPAGNGPKLQIGELRAIGAGTAARLPDSRHRRLGGRRRNGPSRAVRTGRSVFVWGYGRSRSKAACHRFRGTYCGVSLLEFLLIVNEYKRLPTWFDSGSSLQTPRR